MNLPIFSTTPMVAQALQWCGNQPLSNRSHTMLVYLPNYQLNLSDEGLLAFFREALNVNHILSTTMDVLTAFHSVSPSNSQARFYF